MRTFSTLYVNLRNCLPANVYLNTRETEGACAAVCACVFVGSPFSSLLFDRVCQSCRGNDVSTCDMAQRQRRTQSRSLAFIRCVSLSLAVHFSLLSHFKQNWHLSSSLSLISRKRSKLQGQWGSIWVPAVGLIDWHIRHRDVTHLENTLFQH